MVNLLLAKGANINAFDKKDRRALHWAAYMGKAQVVVSCSNFLLTNCQRVLQWTRQTCLWKVGDVFTLFREWVD